MIAIATAYRWTYGELTRGRDGRPGLAPSVLAQTSADWRWYISADPEAEQLDKLFDVAVGDERITVCVEDRSTDLIGLRKQQALEVIGNETWHISLDSDDYLMPDAVAAFARAAAVIEEEGCQTPALAARYRKHRLDGACFDVRPPRRLTFAALRDHPWLHPSGWCYRTTSVRQVGGYRRDLYVGEDYHLQARLAHAFGALGVIEQMLYGRVCRDGGRYDPARWDGAVAAVAAELAELEPLPLTP